MDDWLAHLGLWLVAIFAVGVATAFLRRRAEADGGLSPWLAWGLFAFVVGLVAAGVRALQGRAGLWLDSGLAAYAVFLLGCATSALARGGHLREHRDWALGLLPATLLWVGAGAVEIPKIEASLRAGAEEAEGQAARPQVDSLAAARRAAFLESVRQQAERLARSRAAGGDQTGSVAPAVHSPAPQQRLARLEAARAYLAGLPAAGALAPPACAGALDATQTVSKVLFPTASAEITRAAADALDALTSVLRRCPDAKIEIVGHSDNIGDEASNQALSQRRAEAVRRYLVLEGVAAARLSATGYGSRQPVAPNDDEPGRADNRRIEFLLK